MSAMMILKIFSDCCICFAILGSGPVKFAMPLLLPALLCGVTAGIAAFFDRKGLDTLRRLCAALPLGCLLLAEGGAQLLILAVPAVYTASVILRGNLELEYSSYRHFFVRSLMLLGGVYVVVNIWIFLTQITNEAVFRPDAAVILRYGLVHLLCGVVLQRQLRLGVGYRAEGARRQMAMLLGTAAAIVLGFLVAEPFLRQGLGKVVRELLTLVLTPFAFLLDLAGRLIARLMNTDKEDYDYQEFLNHWENVMMGAGQNAGQDRPHEQISIDPNAIWSVLAGVVVLVAAVLLIRSFHKRSADADAGELTGRVLAAPKKKKTPAMSNRGRVRQCYRDFLRAEKELGMKFKRSDTSQDVLSRIHARTDRPSADALRQVYLQARYDDRQNITRGQVERAKQALRGTRRPQK